MCSEISGEQPTFITSCNPRQESATFLSWVASAPNAAFRFRAIHDRDRSCPSVNVYGTLEQRSDRLTQLNQAGYGIFVIVNGSTGTTDDTVADIRCVFVDFDGIEMPNRKERLEYFCGAAPVTLVRKGTAETAPLSMAIESSPGKYHAYWRCHSMPLERFKPFQQELAYTLGGDPAVCNPSRVMRVPGFLHQKGDPFLSLVRHVRNGYPYSVSADILERALARTMKKFKVKVPEKPVISIPSTPPAPDVRQFKGLTSWVAASDTGERNHNLFGAACQFEKEGAPPEAWEPLFEAARSCGLPDSEIMATVASARKRAASYG